MTPPDVTFAANGMFCPLSCDTVFTTHDRPPTEHAVLIGCLLIAERLAAVLARARRDRRSSGRAGTR